MRLLPGWLAFQRGVSFTLDGDDSIRRRPVDRIAEPLGRMGARIEARDGRYPPFTVHGQALEGVRYELPVASAQVKSCVLLAGLGTDGTTVIEPVASRDHTERMLLRAGASLIRDGARSPATRSRWAAPTSSSSNPSPFPATFKRGVSDRRRSDRARLTPGARGRRSQLDSRRLSADRPADGGHRRGRFGGAGLVRTTSRCPTWT